MCTILSPYISIYCLCWDFWKLLSQSRKSVNPGRRKSIEKYAHFHPKHTFMIYFLQINHELANKSWADPPPCRAHQYLPLTYLFTCNNIKQWIYLHVINHNSCERKCVGKPHPIIDRQWFTCNCVCCRSCVGPAFV